MPVLRGLPLVWRVELAYADSAGGTTGLCDRTSRRGGRPAAPPILLTRETGGK